MKTIISGKVWKFGHNIDTDAMAPWKTLNAGWEERSSSVLHIRPGFIDQVGSGDIIVAGRNWGCGSSREQAAENMKLLGIGAVVAESFGRIYFRNSVAIALPSIACTGVYDAFGEGDEMEINLTTSRVLNLTRGIELKGEPYTPDMLKIIEKGGLMNVLKERMSERQGG
ncbi:MAG: 3-isopropylmalate dehydratase [Deltaproteobacteria bacterium]|nr:3-isopropylmalate dehydratase [Deltaproteobacteria bacterium]